MKKLLPKTLIVLLIGVAASIAAHFDLIHVLSLENLKTRQAELAQFYQTHPAQVIAIYLAIYVVATALSLPGAAVLTLAGGAIFGFWRGTLFASIASTMGATLAFLASRFLLRDWVEKRFSDRFASINKGIDKDGAFYLFTLRLVPAFPFFLINLLMGLTALRVWTFVWVSQVGMLAGTAAYVNAGTQLAQIESLKDILSPALIASFVFIGVLPIFARRILEATKKAKSRKKFERPNHYDYNLIVIGGGSAGLVSAYIAAAVKSKVALIEKHKMGGDCLNTGCVPSKALIRSAKVLSYLKRARDFGLGEAAPRFEFAEVMERVKRVVSKVEPHDSVERYRKLGVDCLTGEARILSPFEVSVDGKVYSARSMIVATGARPLVPAIPGLDKIMYLTSDNLWELRKLPARLLVLGGGPIGCELAQAFARLGSQVTQVEMAPRLMGREDSDVAEFVEKKFRSEGIRVLTSHKAKSFHVESDRKFLRCESDGKEVDIEFDEVLLALGRKANITGFGLEDLGVKISQRGTIEHDEFLRTNYPNIYVCGDVAGPYQFTHTAAHQAWYASVNALFSPLKKFKVDYRVIPWATFTDPEVARVGINEQEAREKHVPFEVTSYGIDDLDRAIAEEEDHGFIKVLTVPGKDKILGVTIVGAHAGDLIAEYVMAMKYGIGLNKILGTIHIYPTFSEANKYVAGNWKRAHAPLGLLNVVEKIHAWRRGTDRKGASQ